MVRSLRVVRCRAGQEPEPYSIEWQDDDGDGEEAMWEAVDAQTGGYSDDKAPFPLDKKFLLICTRSEYRCDFAPNRLNIRGDFIVSGKSPHGAIASLTEQEAAQIVAAIAAQPLPEDDEEPATEYDRFLNRTSVVAEFSWFTIGFSFDGRDYPDPVTTYVVQVTGEGRNQWESIVFLMDDSKRVMIELPWPDYAAQVTAEWLHAVGAASKVELAMIGLNGRKELSWEPRHLKRVRSLLERGGFYRNHCERCGKIKPRDNRFCSRCKTDEVARLLHEAERLRLVAEKEHDQPDQQKKQEEFEDAIPNFSELSAEEKMQVTQGRPQRRERETP